MNDKVGVTYPQQKQQQSQREQQVSNQLKEVRLCDHGLF